MEFLSSLIEILEYNNIESIDIYEIKQQIESIDDNGQLHESIDSMIDIYNYDLRKWLLDNVSYCEEAVSQGLYVIDSDFNLSSFIQAGQYIYYSEQAYELINELTDILN